MERARTSSLDEELRIRLEGADEVLARGVRDLDDVCRRLRAGHEKLERDDVLALKGVLNGLPALDEAEAKADRLEGAGALAQDARRAKDALWQQAKATLTALGKPVDGGLAESLRRLVSALRYLGRPPGPKERTLFEGTLERPWLTSAFLGLQLLLVLLAMSWPIPALALAGTAFVLWLRRSRTRWSLLPDRLQLRAPRQPLLDVQYEAITSVSAGASSVEVRAPELVLELPTRNPTGLAQLLRSMVAHLGSASPHPGPSAVMTVELSTEGRGTALFTPQGVFVVLRAQEDDLVAQVLPGADRATVVDALEVLRHLPPEVLARRLVALPGAWWPGDVVRRDTARLASRTFQRGEQVLHATGLKPERLGYLEDLDDLTRGWGR
ncbi:MAG: hypothetical protein IT380_14085 [Myxococcales bacterium]|nr:hypothetical protein [Myxococcales bacterium]